jgi:hypothetical protein
MSHQTTQLANKSVRQPWRRISGVGAGIVIALIAAFLASHYREIGLILGQNLFISVSDGSILMGYSEYRQQEFGLGPFVTNSNGWRWSTAWRPFHATGYYGDVLVFPLWQPLLVATALTAFAYGYRRGSRQGNPSRCTECGYQLRGVPHLVDQPLAKQCPECGHVHTLNAVAIT